MTEQQNTIQRARDALARWRKDSALVDYQPWSLRSDYPPETRVIGSDSEDVANPGDYAASNASFDSRTARLIVGTAGNPNLLDALDLTLEEGSRWPAGTPIRQHAQRLAAAILSAEERMNA